MPKIKPDCMREPAALVYVRAFVHMLFDRQYHMERFVKKNYEDLKVLRFVTNVSQSPLN
uniref:Uncharacterized protein n=1 Tax=Tetranychus urticae TaxID=32264 RepID=T1KJ75_TETUR